jgi:hypothetical protein
VLAFWLRHGLSRRPSFQGSGGLRERPSYAGRPRAAGDGVSAVVGVRRGPVYGGGLAVRSRRSSPSGGRYARRRSRYDPHCKLCLSAGAHRRQGRTGRIDCGGRAGCRAASATSSATPGRFALGSGARGAAARDHTCSAADARIGSSQRPGSARALARIPRGAGGDSHHPAPRTHRSAGARDAPPGRVDRLRYGSPGATVPQAALDRPRGFAGRGGRRRCLAVDVAEHRQALTRFAGGRGDGDARRAGLPSPASGHRECGTSRRSCGARAGGRNDGLSNAAKGRLVDTRGRPSRCRSPPSTAALYGDCARASPLRCSDPRSKAHGAPQIGLGDDRPRRSVLNALYRGCAVRRGFSVEPYE